jgi:sulfur carrier protein ThiS
MYIRVVLVGLLRDYGAPSRQFRLPRVQVTIDELLEHLAIPPDLVAIALVNGLQRSKSHQLVAGDVVKLVPIMGGG